MEKEYGKMLKRSFWAGLLMLAPSFALAQDLPQRGPYLSWVTQSSMVISWRTSTPDSSVVQYELTAGYERKEKDLALKTAHSLT